MAKRVGWGVGVGLVAAAFGVWAMWTPRGAPKRSSETRPSPLAIASRARLPSELKGVELELQEQALRKRRPRATRHHGADDETFFAYAEALPRGGHALYLFSRRSDRLARVQVAESLSGSEGIVARVREMQGRYGPPDGVWDCPAAGEHPPTRRFTWTRGGAGAMDAYLLLGDHASATLLVASALDVERSVERAACQVVSSERFSQFPALPLPKR